MLDFAIGLKLYESVMKNGKVKNKLWGFFWREFLVFAAMVCAVLVLALIIKGRNFPWNLAALVLAVLMIPCALVPLFHFRVFSVKD